MEENVLHLKAKTISIIPFGIIYMLSLPLLGILLAETGIRNSLLIYILAFTITMVSAIILFRLFSGTLLLELQKEKIRMDWIKKPIYSSIKPQTINLKDISHWKHQEGKGVDRFKIYLKHKKKYVFNSITFQIQLKILK
ncbi:hypothetical protein FLSI110296_01020 [Flavobacterium sinopsychrotolerans]|uniref:Uncharacterized protein n=1 Tax=Flavobacterium sinopsychrotolerans TaxID=604089 RepID=A0A1H8I7K1_9FLAO|nr:hypothetical protein [Flavobacterium sinopsychrotolerans]SEN63838.1 hypothetical protein SAMN04487942_0448 [Flavobacterium sinopsychrotolerans]